MDDPAADPYQDIRDGVRALCAQFPDEYHRKVDTARAYPEEFVDALTRAGWLAAMIPQEYGGSGLGLTEASVIMEEINRSGGNSGACHGQMYNMGTLLRHGSEAQKRAYLPKIATGELRLQSMAVTEPSTGTDTTRIKTLAVTAPQSAPPGTAPAPAPGDTTKPAPPEPAKFRIVGNTVDIQALTRFVKLLEASPFIQNVTWGKSEIAMVDGKEVTEFSLDAQYQRPDSSMILTKPVSLSVR